MLRDQGFAPALEALAEQVGTRNQIRVDLEIEEPERIGQTAQVALYTIIRELLDHPFLLPDQRGDGMANLA